MRALIVCFVGVAACGRSGPRQYAPGECLALPAATRGELVDDGRQTLYWLQDVPQYDFDRALHTYTELMRFDLDTRTLWPVADDVRMPLRWMQGHMVARRAMPPTFNTALVAIRSDGQIQSLVPDHLDVVDFEPIDDHRIALLADGEGPRGIYTVEFDGKRPVRLMDADRLQTISGERVIATVGDHLVSVDMKTGKQERLVRRERTTPNERFALWVDHDFVKERDVFSGREQVIVGDAQPWKLGYQHGSVLARTKPDKSNASRAYLISAGIARKLPTVVGGATISATTELAGHMWALIAHNTTNFAGDFVDQDVESDICMMPPSGKVSFATRRVPARFAHREARLFAAAARVVPNALIGIDDIAGERTAIYIDVPERLPDLDSMRRRAREIDEQLTSVLGDPDVRTDVVFGDRMHARVTWSHDHTRRRTVVGMGDALVTDSAELDVEVQNLDETNKDGKITCAGTMVNLQPHRLDDIEVWCVRDRRRVVSIPRLEPSATVEFSGTFDAEAGDDLDLDFYGGGRRLQVRLARGEALLRSVMDLATHVYADTGLWLHSHDWGKDQLEVTLTAEQGWENKAVDERSKIAAKAYEQYRTGFAAMHKADANRPLRLHIAVQVVGVAYTYDGDVLEQDE